MKKKHRDLLRSPKFSFVESKTASGRVCFGYSHFDNPPVMLSSDYDTAMDPLLAITRGEIKPDDELITSALGEADDEVTQDDVLTSEETE